MGLADDPKSGDTIATDRVTVTRVAETLLTSSSLMNCYP
jgi:hypothetical protein